MCVICGRWPQCLSGLRVKQCVVSLLGFKRPNLGFHQADVKPIVQPEIAAVQQAKAQLRPDMSSSCCSTQLIQPDYSYTRLYKASKTESAQRLQISSVLYLYRLHSIKSLQRENC